MIWHFFEVWLLILGTFVIGCTFGAALYASIGNGRFATVQGAVADSIGDTIDGIKSRFGLGPAWRDGFRVPVVRPLPQKKERRKEREEPRFEDEYAADRAAAPHTEDDYREEEEWSEDDNWREDSPAIAAADNGYAYEDEPDGRALVAIAEPVTAVAAAAPDTDDSTKRPAGLAGPRNGVPDNLQRIRGIGKGNEDLLNGLGIYHFGQIAAWTPAEMRWVAAHLPFPERIARDDWVGQAIILASGGDTGYVKSAERRRARRANAEAEQEDEGTAE